MTPSASPRVLVLTTLPTAVLEQYPKETREVIHCPHCHEPITLGIESAEWREVVESLTDALCMAMDAVQGFVHGAGPRGMDLLPLLRLADEAADKRDALLEGQV